MLRWCLQERGVGRIKPKQNFVLLTEGSGALELGMRYSQFDASDFTTANTAGTGQLKAGLTNEANAWTLGGGMDPEPEYTAYTQLRAQLDF